jgi:thiol-disulfide isomerase/thioredoxin
MIARQAVARNWAGALAGGIVFLVLGAYAGERLGGSYAYTVPSTRQDGGELEIAGPTLSGETFSIQQWRGKVVLVDFWATWCPPCRAEMPNLKGVYARHHADGLEIVGVSLDSDREKLEAYVQASEIPWPQVFFDDAGTPGWINPLARKYRIQAIPATFLLDREGKVVAYDLHGSDLTAAIVKLMKLEASRDTRVNQSGARLELATFPLGLVLGAALGCIAGSLGGALVERGLRHVQAKMKAE